MFEVAELGLKLSKEEFAGKEDVLHTQLLQAQRDLQQAQRAVVILVSGVEGAGKGHVVNRLNEWLDSRGMETSAFLEETDDQSLRPRYWRFWQTLPQRGRIGIMFGSWYTKPLAERVFGKLDEPDYELRLQEIADFERMLALDGVILIKLWFHLPKSKVEKQLKADEKDPGSSERKTRWSKRYLKHYEKFMTVSETALRKTDLGHAPWHVIEATDVHYRDITAGQIILDTLQQKLRETAAVAVTTPAVKSGRPRKKKPLTVLDILNPDIALDEATYKKKLEKWQRELTKLSWQAHDLRRSVVVVFEGWDAAGKGGAIQRMTKAIDARIYKVISVSKPTDEEAAHHYLWRFWRHIPLAGNISIYDRSWYGRVLVERVEQYAKAEEWQRAFGEINLFEQQLTGDGIIVLKFWLHISPQEQLARFRERKETPWKKHKLTADDWRNRQKWDEYKQAVNDMVAHTSTTLAPWYLIPANDQKYARVDVLKTLCKELKKALKGAEKK